MDSPPEVVGSIARDFCMLERNFLAHLKLVLLLLVLLSSTLLGTRLTGSSTGTQAAENEASADSEPLGKASLPVATIQLLAALAVIGAAIWEYHTGVKDVLSVRAFFAIARVHFPIMVTVTAIIVATCGVYLVYST